MHKYVWCQYLMFLVTFTFRFYSFPVRILSKGPLKVKNPPPPPKKKICYHYSMLQNISEKSSRSVYMKRVFPVNGNYM